MKKGGAGGLSDGLVHQLLTMLSIALFATCRYTQLPRFLSPFPDESEVRVVALFHSWEFPGVMFALSADHTVFSGSKQVSSLVRAGPSASASVDQTTGVQFSQRTVSCA